MAQQMIRCRVRSCYYNENGERCLAEVIEVQNNPPGKAGEGRMEFGSLEGDPQVGQAAASTQTMCGTFIPREKGPKSGIRRLT
ncbi:MAG: DUF1540 domain-containing protein [Firmicutes bacterium]|nr:DUF1540 domain-containing protein [Bacillota bacterium]